MLIIDAPEKHRARATLRFGKIFHNPSAGWKPKQTQAVPPFVEGLLYRCCLTVSRNPANPSVYTAPDVIKPSLCVPVISRSCLGSLAASNSFCP